MLPVEEVIEKLGLEAHPEGGYFKQTYRSREVVDVEGVSRRAATDIYFLVTADRPSRLHTLSHDETWHFYYGDPVEVVQITPKGETIITRMGPDFMHGDTLQHAVPHDCWFGARVATGYALVGCTCAPGFEFSDFILAGRTTLTTMYPRLADLIAELT